MRFLFTRAAAFGPFTDETLDFASGMTVVWGQNEAGKSSWHAAVYAGLCGLRRGAGRKKEDKAFAALHKPWDDARWSVSTAVEMDDQRRLEFTQDLASLIDCRVRDMVTGEDISGDYINEGAPDGAMLLGLTRSSLPSVLCVRQTEILRVLEDAADLQKYLQKAAATGGRDATAEEAINRISNFRSERIGLERSNSTKPLQSSINMLAGSRENLDEVREEQAQLVSLINDREDREAEAEVAEGRLAAVRGAAMRRQVVELSKRIARIRQLATLFPDGPPPEANVEDEVKRTVDRAIAAWSSCPQDTKPLDGSTAEALQREMEALPSSPPKGDVEPAASVQTIRADWERLGTQLDAHKANRPDYDVEETDVSVGAPELRRLADDLERKAPDTEGDLEVEIEALQHSGGGIPRWLPLTVGSTGICVGLGLVAVGWTLAGVAAIAAMALAALELLQRSGPLRSNPEITRLETRLAIQREQHSQFVRIQSQAQARAAKLGLSADAPALRYLAQRLDDAELETRRLNTWTDRREELASQLADAATRLRKALAERSVTDLSEGDLTEDIGRYFRECSERARMAHDCERRRQLGERLVERQQLEDRQRRDAELHDQARSLVAEAANAVGCEAQDVAVAIEGLEAYRKDVVKRSQARDAAWQQWSEYQALLDDSSPEDLEEELERAESELARLPAPEAPSSVDAEVDLDMVEREAREARARAVHLSGQVAERQQRARSVAEAEEMLAAAETEFKRVRELDRLTAATLEFLRTAKEQVQHDIAPRLADAIADRLPQVTGGRYQEARVNPEDLNIQVRATGGKWRDATLVSQGTSEQIYLLLRLALAEQLVTTNETAPLLLDDVMVQSDRGRTMALLALMHEVSQTRQVILFSQEGAVREWAVENLASSRDSLVLLDTQIAP